jgi:CNT family concentrative nucleoside transporter
MPCGPRAPHPRNLELPTDEPLNLSQLHSLLGVFAFGLIAWMLSERRSVVAWRVVASGMLLQLALAALLLKVPGSQAFFVAINDAVAALDGATRTGTAFVFGFLGGAPLPYAETAPGASFVLAFRALPLVLVIGALSSLLYYWGVLQWIVRAFSWLLRKTMGVSGAIGLSSAANVFVGMVEAPMVVRPYLAAMSRSELFVVMTAGMASIAGTVFALYAVILGPVVPDAAGHLLAASLISAPAAITVAVLMLPDERAHAGESAELARSESTGTMDAITRGTQDAVGLLINIVAMLIVLVALVSLVNMLLGALLPQVGGAALSLQRIFGWVMAPVAWLVGIPWAEAAQAGALFGTKTVLNEFLAYLEMARLPAEALSPRSRLLLTYALCGFANFGSVGIMVGGLHAMVPERRRDIVVLATRSIVSGTLATCMTAAWVGALTP